MRSQVYKTSRRALTVTIAVVSRDLLANGNRFYHTKRNVPPFAKELAVVIAVMLGEKSR
jgi:hypothetical protein